MAASEEQKEGADLLGSPTFTELQNGRLKCVETGHELVVKDKEAYSRSKRCRLGLIEYALSHKKPPLNLFKQDPKSCSRLICKLTGDTVNKSEEHIWKHINGKRFLNRLEKAETKNGSHGSDSTEGKKKRERKPKPRENGVKETKKKEKDIDDAIPEGRDDDDCADNEELDFWMPPVGDRWDFDDGGDRWGSDSEAEQEEEHVSVGDEGENSEEALLSMKRMPEETELNGSASRKKKCKNHGEIELNGSASRKKKTKKNHEEIELNGSASRKKKSKKNPEKSADVVKSEN